MKLLKNILKTSFLGLISIALLLAFTIIVIGTCALGICIISLGIYAKIYVLPIIIGVALIYISFLNSKLIYEDLDYIIQDIRWIIGDDSFCSEDMKSNTSKEISESEENNKVFMEEVNILKKEYSLYKALNNDCFAIEVKEQFDTMMKIQDCINNLEKIAKKQLVLQIEEVWEKIRLNVVNNLIQCLVYIHYMNLDKETITCVVRKLTEENKKLLNNQEVLLNNTMVKLTNKMLEKKEKEYEYLILELDAMQAVVSNVINMY